MTVMLDTARWRVMAITVLRPVATMAAFPARPDYAPRRSAVSTSLELKSSRINARVEGFVDAGESATGAPATLIASVNPGLLRDLPRTPEAVTVTGPPPRGFPSRNSQPGRELTSGPIAVESMTGIGGEFPLTLHGTPLYSEETPADTFNKPVANMTGPPATTAAGCQRKPCLPST